MGLNRQAGSNPKTNSTTERKHQPHARGEQEQGHDGNANADDSGQRYARRDRMGSNVGEPKSPT